MPDSETQDTILFRKSQIPSPGPWPFLQQRTHGHVQKPCLSRGRRLAVAFSRELCYSIGVGKEKDLAFYEPVARTGAATAPAATTFSQDPQSKARDLILLPQAIAYALIAELPPRTGLYSTIVAALIRAGHRLQG